MWPASDTELDVGSLDVELGTPPVAALSVVLRIATECVRGATKSQYDCTGRTWILVSDLRRNHWGMGLIHASQIPCSSVVQLCRCYSPVLAGSLGEDALRAEGFLGRLNVQFRRNQHASLVHDIWEDASTGGRDIPLLSVSFAGGSAVGGKGRKNKVSDGKGSVQF